MLLRILGEEKEAQNTNYTNPFTDVPAWAEKYVAYAYSKGYTSGISATQFGSDNIAAPEQFFTFMLRALGYSDKAGVDFVWNESIQKAEALGIISSGKYAVGSSFTRGDCVDVIYCVLNAELKGETVTLAESLVAKGAIDVTIAAKYEFYVIAPTATPTPTPTPAPQYQMVRVSLRENKNGILAIFGADIRTKIKEAEYVVFSWAGEDIGLTDYEKVYMYDYYEDLISPNKPADLEDYLKNDYQSINKYKELGKAAKIVATVYDKKANMIASSIAEFCFWWFKSSNYDGSFHTDYSITGFKGFTGDRMHPYVWDSQRYIVFA